MEGVWAKQENTREVDIGELLNADIQVIYLNYFKLCILIAGLTTNKQGYPQRGNFLQEIVPDLEDERRGLRNSPSTLQKQTGRLELGKPTEREAKKKKKDVRHHFEQNKTQQLGGGNQLE